MKETSETEIRASVSDAGEWCGADAQCVCMWACAAVRQQSRRSHASPRSTSWPQPAPTSDCVIVIEAAPEQLDLERGIIESLDQIAPPHALVATNTSLLPISEIAKSLRDPSRLVGMQFFNPGLLVASPRPRRRPT